MAIIRLDSPGPGLFAQQRVGRHGRVFRMFKLRTMLANTGAVPSHQVGAAQITRVGRTLRKLKLDGSLVADLVTGADAAIIAQTVAAMAKGLGLRFAAEGVASEAQLARLRALGCEEWQGALFSEPVDAAAFAAMLAQSSRAASA